MLQHVLRIPLRRSLLSNYSNSRAVKTLTRPTHVNRGTTDGGEGKNGLQDDINCVQPDGDDSKRDGYKEPLPVYTHATLAITPRSKSSPTSQDVAESGPGSACKRRHTKRKCSNELALYSTIVDVDCLRPYELAVSSKGEDPTTPSITDDDLQGILRTAFPVPFKRTINRLPHPISPQELELRLHQALTFTPAPSLSRLINYHDQYPALHSAPSYNFLVNYAVLHSSYSKGLHLLRQMEDMGIKPNRYSKQLYVRSLVRIGRLDSAWSYVQRELMTPDNKTAMLLLIELLGHCNPVEFHNRPLRGSSPELNAMPSTPERPQHEVRDTPVQNWQEGILAVISRHLPSNGLPPFRFIFAIVRHLLHIQRTENARAVMLEWSSRLPEHLDLPRKRHCLCLLHLYLAFTPKTFVAHRSNRQFVDLYLQKHPNFQPDSTTLFLLLRSLTRAKTRPTLHALKLVKHFREKWGPGMIDRRVRRRVASIATREGCLSVAREWLEMEERASLSRGAASLEQDVVGEQAVKLPRRTRRISFQKLMPGIGDENRKWIWLKRRIWRREQAGSAALESKNT